MNQDNDNQNTALAAAGAIVFGVVALVLGLAIHNANGKKPKVAIPAVAASAAAGTASVAASVAASGSAPMPSAVAPASAAAPAAAGGDRAKVVVEGGVVKFFFASGAADIAPEGAQALVDVLKGTQAGKKAVVSGYSDASGDATKNAELAKLRAFAVRDTLKALKVPEAQIELRKPQAIAGNAAGSSADARRVDVTLE